MSLSRKHYERAAAILRDVREEARNHADKPAWDDATALIEAHMVTWFRADNPNFRPDTFRKAAQP